MADPALVAARTANAVDRLNEGIAALAEGAGLSDQVSPLRRRYRDAGIGQAERLEQLADSIDRLRGIDPEEARAARKAQRYAGPNSTFVDATEAVAALEGDGPEPTQQAVQTTAAAIVGMNANDARKALAVASRDTVEAVVAMEQSERARSTVLAAAEARAAELGEE